MKKLLKKPLYIISIVLAVFVITISIGYAFFSESLTINGVASTMEYYDGNRLPVQPVIRDTTENLYYTATDSQYHVTFRSENWEDDTYTLTLYKGAGLIPGKKTITYTISFINPTELDYTNGTATAEITQNGMSYIKNVSANLSSSTVAPGQSVDVNLVIESNIISELGEHTVKGTYTYTYQNKPRYLYFVIKYVNKF